MGRRMERGGGGMGAQQRWKRLKERLRFKGVACCGSPWSAPPLTPPPPHPKSTRWRGRGTGGRRRRRPARNQRESYQDFGCILDQASAGDAVAVIEEVEEKEMNLAKALAAKRQLRAAERDAMMTPFTERSSLMRLMDEWGRKWGSGGGAACVWGGGRGRRSSHAGTPSAGCPRGSCPLCNQLILETPDIY